jgi:predicted AAA+ superfamily ATPase
VLTGSQNFALHASVSQSLAGRAAVLHLLPLCHGEVVRFARHPTTLDEVMLAGGYPRIFDQRLKPADWLASYIATYIERDVRAVSNVGDLSTFQRFVELCAGRTAQLLNYAALAADCGISQPTAKAWLSVLEASFIVFRLPAFHSNHRKRLVKMPKLHFLDTGLACWLLGIRSADQLRSHPLRGPIFETWVASEVLKQRTHRGERVGLSFYRDRDAAEADLLIERSGRLTIVEAKSAQTASSSLFQGAERVRGHLHRSGRRVDVVVAYGGAEAQARTAARLVPWNQMKDQRWV